MVVTLDRLTSGLSDNTELFEMSKEEGDLDGLQAIADDAATLETDIKQLEFRRMFNNPADPMNAFVTSRPAPAAPRPATGPACCCVST